MTLVSNAFTTFSAIGNREDLSNTIYDISPTDTPFLSAIKKTKATNPHHEWQTDALDDAAANTQLEGDVIVPGASTATTRLANATQILYKACAVTETQNATNSAGRAREMTYQLMKRNKELRRDQEFALLNNQTPVPQASASSSTARALRPVNAWITTNDDGNLRGENGSAGNSTTAATDGTQRDLTEDLVKEGLRKAWNAGGEPDMVLAGPSNKQKFSTFGGNATRYIAASDRLVAGIAYYEHDFGIIKVVPDRFSRDRDLWVFDTEYWAWASLRGPKTEDLGRTGDATQAYIVVEGTLESRNEAASAVVADLTTA